MARKQKEIERSGLQMIIKEMPAQQAAFWGLRLMGKLLGSAQTTNADKMAAMLQKQISEFVEMPKEDFDRLWRDALGSVIVKYEGGQMPLIDEFGHVTTDKLDSAQLFNLFIDSCLFSFAPLFLSEGLEQVMTGQTLENSQPT